MNKALLLTKSNLRKNRGTSVGLFLLMMIATCLIGISLLIFFDCYPTVSKAAERLNSGDGFFQIYDSVDGFTDDKIDELIGSDTDSYFVYRNLAYHNIPVKFGEGKIVTILCVTDPSAFSRDMNRFEVVKEDTSITENYVYLPYQFNTAGGFETGDTFEYEYTGKKYSYAEMAEMAGQSTYAAYVDATDNRFMAPESMLEEVKAALREQGSPEPETLADVLRAVTLGLAVCYRDSIQEMAQLTGQTFTSLNIVGGGSQNLTLNRLTAEITGLPVYAGPTEGTALGNLAAQMIADGAFADLAAFRAALPNSFEITQY